MRFRTQDFGSNPGKGNSSCTQNRTRKIEFIVPSYTLYKLMVKIAANYNQIELEAALAFARFFAKYYIRGLFCNAKRWAQARSRT